MTPDPWCLATFHGTAVDYVNRYCRCDQARAAYSKARRRKLTPFAAACEQRITERAAAAHAIAADPDDTYTAGCDQFPIGPLVALVERLDNPQDSTSTWRLYHRAKARGHVSAVTADALAVRLLGIHPCFVWGDTWWITEAAA